MYIWIVGASGMLGSELIKTLKKRQIPHVGTDRKQADLTSFSSLKNFIQKHPEITHLINCAAYTQVDLAEKNPKEAFQVNVEGVKNLKKILEKFSLKKLLHFSTDYVFDGNQETPYLESSECNPLSVYGTTKYEGEKLLWDHPLTCVIRTSWLFGKGKIHFASKILQKLQNDENVPVVTDQWGRLTYCEDLANVSLELLPYSGIFHFANQGIVSWYEIATFIQEKASTLGILPKMHASKIFPISSKDFSAAAKRPLFSALDTKKIEHFLHFSPRHWKDALTHYLEELL